MTGGITSVPLPAYWSSKDPEQWRRYPWKRLAWANPRCAANYATVFNELPAKRRRRPYSNSSISRSLSATVNPNTPVESERNSKKEYVARCSDCNAPLVPVTQSDSRSTTLTPPTPVQVRTVAPGSFPAGLNRNCRIPHYLPPQTWEAPPYYLAGSTKWDASSRALPPSECGDYSSEGLGPSCREDGRLFTDVGDYAREQDCRPPSLDQASTGGTITAHSVNENHELEDVLPNFIGISGTTLELEETARSSQHQIREDDIQLAHAEGNYVGSQSSASPVASEKGSNLFSDVRPVFDGNRVSSFYNVLFTPYGNASNDQQVVLDMRKIPGERDLRLKLAVEIAVFSTFVTVLILACSPWFQSGLRNHLLGCCSCTCSRAAGATTPGPHFGQLQWFERWAYRGASSVFGFQSPGQAVGSTVLM